MMTQATFVIYKKELKSLFTTSTFYSIGFLMTIILGALFILNLTKFGSLAGHYMMQLNTSPRDLNIHYGVFLPHLSLVNLLFIMFIPAMTMRLLSEEKKIKTFDLLLTSPLTSLDIALGKFLAAATAVLVLLVIAMIYPLATSRVAEGIQWSSFFVAAFGIFLVGLVYVAMDLFASSLSESSMISYILAIVFNLSIWFIGSLSDVVESDWARRVVEHISLNTHLTSLIDGTLKTNGLVFILSVIVLFSFLAERMIESSRWR